MKFELGNGMRRRGGVLGTMVLTLALGLAPGAATAEAPREHQVEVPAAAGSIVAVDPATGELRTPTAAEVQALTATTRLAAGSEHVAIATSPDGTEMADVPAGLMSATVIWINADGSTGETCVDGLDAAAFITQLGGLGSTVEDR